MIYINTQSETPYYIQIYHEIIQEILSGARTRGDKLPPTRLLAHELGVGRNTVDRAYQQLVAEGYITSRIGSGFIVNEIPGQFGLHFQLEDSIPVSPVRNTCKPPVPASSARNAAVPASSPRHDAAHTSSRKPILYDFSYGSMDNQLFPYKNWRKSTNRILDELECSSTLAYPCRQGEPRLRESIARHLARSRNVHCSADQIIITCGQQHSMEIIANMFQNTLHSFAMEDPGYDGIRVMFENHKYDVIPIPYEEKELHTEALRNLTNTLFYLTPSHQFPTGVVLPVARRLALTKWAFDHDSYLIEDDYDSELCYYTNPIPAMYSLDRYKRTIYTGTFSKSLSPHIRIAYIVLPESLIDLYQEYYHRYNAQVSPIHQLIVADFIDSGFYEQYINRLRTTYKKKHSDLVTAIRSVFHDQAVITGTSGVHILLDVYSPLSADALIERAASIGIQLYSVRAFYYRKETYPEHQILLGFPAIPSEKFHDIFERLYQVWEL